MEIMLDDIGFLEALAGGFSSFFTGCVMPFLPGFVAYIIAVYLIDNQTGRAPKLGMIVTALFYQLGFNIIFIINRGYYVGKYDEYAPMFGKIGGAWIIIVGLAIAGVIEMKLLSKSTRIRFSINPLALFLAMFIGGMFSLGWIPCSGEALGKINGLLGMEESFKHGLNMFMIYNIGLSIPFLLISLIFTFLTPLLKKFKDSIIYIEMISGKILVLIGMMLFLGSFRNIAETFGIVTLLSGSIIFTSFLTVIATQAWVLETFISWLKEKEIPEIPWSSRLLFFIDILSVTFLQITTIFQENMMAE